MGIAFRRQADAGLLQQFRIDGREVGIVEQHGRCRIGDIEYRIAAIPVRRVHDVLVADFPHRHVVKKRVAEIEIDLGNVQYVQVDFSKEARAARIGDVENIDILRILIVHRHQIGLVADRPSKGAVGLVRVRSGAVAKSFLQLHRLQRIGDVIEHEAALVVLAAGFCIHDQHVALEPLGIELQHLHAFTGTGVLRHGNKIHALGCGGVRDVNNPSTGVGRVDAAGFGAGAIGLAPVCQIGIFSEGRDVCNEIGLSTGDFVLRHKIDVTVGTSADKMAIHRPMQAAMRVGAGNAQNQRRCRTHQ